MSKKAIKFSLKAEWHSTENCQYCRDQAICSLLSVYPLGQHYLTLPGLPGLPNVPICTCTYLLGTYTYLTATYQV